MKLGPNQISCLECLLDHSGYYPGCGWTWSTPSKTKAIMDSLVMKGMAFIGVSGKHREYRITPEGKAWVMRNSLYYMIKYSPKKEAKSAGTVETAAI